MANVNSAFGLRPVRYMGGGPYNGAVNPYILPSSYATAAYIGDPVVVTGTASVPTAIKGYAALPQINVATAGATNQVTGCIVGFVPTPGIIDLGYGAASTERIALVADDPALLFEIMEDSDSNAVELAEIGLNANLIAGSGSAYTKKSGWKLDSTSAGADATFQLTIRGYADRPDNTPASNYAKLLVTINLHTNRLAAVAGV